jgi:hypothetical protein
MSLHDLLTVEHGPHSVQLALELVGFDQIDVAVLVHYDPIESCDVKSKDSSVGGAVAQSAGK